MRYSVIHLGRFVMAAVLILAATSCSVNRRATARIAAIAIPAAGRINSSSSSSSSSVKLSGAASTDALLTEATSWLGTPYKYGGRSKSGVDCSGLMLEVYSRALSIDLPRNSVDQRDYCTPIPRNQLREGDLVFFAPSRGKISHVGMYVGGGRIIHSSTSQGVIISSLSESWYSSSYHSSGRPPRYATLLAQETSAAAAKNTASAASASKAKSKSKSKKSEKARAVAQALSPVVAGAVNSRLQAIAASVNATTPIEISVSDDSIYVDVSLFD